MSETEDAITSIDPAPEVEEEQPEMEDTSKIQEETSAADADVAAEEPAKEDAETDNSNAADDDAKVDEKMEVTETDTDQAKESSEAKDEEVDDAAKDEEAADGDEKESEEKEKETKTPKKKRAKRGAAVATPGTSSASKRQRKSTTSFSPQNFKEDKDAKKIEIPSGRGIKLEEIEVIKATVSKKKNTDPILVELHKFIFGGPGGCLGKGRTSKKLIKKHILEFSGYLPDVVEGDEEAEEMEREAEVSIG